MAVVYTQTQTNTLCSANNNYCAAGTATTTDSTQKECTEGGTAGSTEVGRLILGTLTRNNAIFGIVPGTVTGDSGTWTVRLNVTTANMNLSISEIYICRVNSSCVNQETIGSATGLSISLGSTGVKTQTVTGSAVTLGAGDIVTVVFKIVNGAMTDQSFNFTPDQNIDSPFTAAGGGGNVFINRGLLFTSKLVQSRLLRRV